MRALLVVNSTATTTTNRTLSVIERALAAELSVELAHTERRGHATDLAKDAVARDIDVVFTLGGDGTVNEVVNGLLAAGTGLGAPALGVIPGGSTNVFARTLGLPNDPVRATHALLAAVRAGRRRTVSVGQADGRYFTFCCGLGFDAEIIDLVERRRAAGRRPTNGLYVRSGVRQFFFGTERRHGMLTLSRPGTEPVKGLFLAIVSNSSPWTYLGNRPLTPTPRAGFGADLDLIALTGMGTFTMLRALGQLARSGGRGPHGPRVLSLHDVPEFTLTASSPVALQLDGDHLGTTDGLSFRSVPEALTVVA